MDGWIDGWMIDDRWMHSHRGKGQTVSYGCVCVSVCVCVCVSIFSDSRDANNSKFISSWKVFISKSPTLRERDDQSKIRAEEQETVLITLAVSLGGEMGHPGPRTRPKQRRDADSQK